MMQGRHTRSLRVATIAAFALFLVPWIALLVLWQRPTPETHNDGGVAGGPLIREPGTESWLAYAWIVAITQLLFVLAAGLLHRLTGLSLVDIVVRRQRILAVVAGGAIVGLACFTMLELLYVKRGPALTASLVCFVGTSILFRLLDQAVQRYLARPEQPGRDVGTGRNGSAP